MFNKLFLHLYIH